MHLSGVCALAVVAFLSFESVSCTNLQNYVDENLLTSGLTEGAIAAFSGEVLAKSSNFNPEKEEILKVIGGFSDRETLRDGMYLSGQRYVVITGDENTIYGKKGESGAICCKTSQSLLIGINNGGLLPGSAAVIVEKLCDDLKSKGL